MAVLNKYKSGIPLDAVYIGRGSKWGNPFKIGMDGTRYQVIEKHREWLWQQVQDGGVSLESLASLCDKDLVCFCAPQPCHGDTLEKAAKWAKMRLETDVLK